MNEDLFNLECKINGNDKLYLSDGSFICFTVIQDDVENTICINTKQALQLINKLQVICNGRLD